MNVAVDLNTDSCQVGTVYGALCKLVAGLQVLLQLL